MPSKVEQFGGRAVIVSHFQCETEGCPVLETKILSPEVHPARVNPPNCSLCKCVMFYTGFSVETDPVDDD